MLVWVVGAEGLLGKAMMEVLDVPLVGSSHEDADVLDLKGLENFYLEHRPTHIVNCSAVVEVDKAEGELSSLAEDINVKGVVHLAVIAKKYHLKVIHISTDYVFDGRKKTDYVEEDAVNPVNGYGRTKLEGERRLLQILPESAILRTASLYGKAKKGLIDSLVFLLQTKEECSFVTDQISSPTNVEDVAVAVKAILEKSGVYHFVNKGFCSRFELLVFVKGLMEKYGLEVFCKKLVESTQKDFPRPATRPVRSVLCTKKIEPLMEFPIRSWQSALESFFLEKWVHG
ncbi:dTDP-4-dehydrorhamnose reductase [bacterium]|nr:dTDP-4-dehydrorhamnose reductase [bacterium]